jgi:uncharacterized coiled-coil protein SlyX
MDPSSTRREERIDELEARLTEHDQAILALSDEIYRQQRQIATLETELRLLVERTKVEPQGPSDESTEIPPHY